MATDKQRLWFDLTVWIGSAVVVFGLLATEAFAERGRVVADNAVWRRPGVRIVPRGVPALTAVGGTMARTHGVTQAPLRHRRIGRRSRGSRDRFLS